MDNNIITETRVASMDDLVPLFKESLSQGRSVKFKPKGISMLPMLRQDRDTVTLSPITDKLKKYDVVLYRRDNGKYVLHRIVKTGKTYTMMGDNQFVKEHGIRIDQIIAVVTAFTRDQKEYAMDSATQKIYCRLRYHSRLLRRVYRALKHRAKRIFKKR